MSIVSVVACLLQGIMVFISLLVTKSRFTWHISVVGSGVFMINLLVGLYTNIFYKQNILVYYLKKKADDASVLQACLWMWLSLPLG